MSTATIGHNSGYADYWQLRMAIWDSREPLVVKAMALSVLEYMRPDMLETTVSRRRIREMCGISENTLERHWGAIVKWIEVIKAQGKASVYRARIYACASELVTMVPSKALPSNGATHMGVPPANYPTENGYPPQTTPLDGGRSTPQDGGRSALYKDNNNNYPSADDVVGDARPPERDPVYVNGIGVRGPWFTLDNEMIRVAGQLNAIPETQRLPMAELIARRWVLLKERPVSVMDALSRGMARQKLNLQCDAVKLQRELEKVQADQRQSTAETSPRALAPPGQKHWRDEKREKSKMISELVSKVAAGKP